MGLGNRSLSRVPVDADFRMEIAALRTAIAADRRAGRHPIAVIGNAGTVNTGAIDDLAAIAGVCAEEGLWFHVDGAFGALLRLSPELRPLVAGIERADSLAFDLHKWGSLPFECACLLVRDAQAHRDAFALAPSYMAAHPRGALAWGLPFSDRGIDLTRNFKALKAWMCLKTYGGKALARVIERNVEQARHLGRLVEAHPRMELLAPVSSNIVCFRFKASDDVNREILYRLQESGVSMPSSTILHGRFALRAAIVNHRTRTEDVEALATAVLKIAEAL
jgi:glutamate/tyrosine decarboxylase-like PLP-dependent enzyme